MRASEIHDSSVDRIPGAELGADWPVPIASPIWVRTPSNDGARWARILPQFPRVGRSTQNSPAHRQTAAGKAPSGNTKSGFTSFDPRWSPSKLTARRRLR